MDKELHVAIKKKLLFFGSCFLVRKEVRIIEIRKLHVMSWEMYLLIVRMPCGSKSLEFKELLPTASEIKKT